jgi:alkyl sulfatase BDS1-like metallo-beta-lactamase superfamily hydrolase
MRMIYCCYTIQSTRLTIIQMITDKGMRKSQRDLNIGGQKDFIKNQRGFIENQRDSIESQRDFTGGKIIYRGQKDFIDKG